MKKSTRHEAVEAGHTTYQGTPCRVCGKTLRRTVNTSCVDCGNRIKRERYANHSKDQRDRHKASGRKAAERYRNRNRTNLAIHIGKMVSRAKSRAVRDGIPFSLTKADVTIPDVCPVLGIPLDFVGGHPKGNAPSLDRVIQDRGYVPDNVVVISTRANILKRDATIEELGKLWAYYSRFA